MKLACLRCGNPLDVPEGTDVARLSCPKCGTAQATLFTYAKTLRFEPVDEPRFAAACEHARAGRRDEALVALEEALRGGYRDLERIESEPALAGLRDDPRFAALLNRYRPGGR